MSHLDNEFPTLKGKTITFIRGMEDGSEEVEFLIDDDTMYMMYHEQDCCESVYLAEVVGDPEDLIGTPILLAEVVDGESGPEEKYTDSYTWTYYKLSTIKGSVTLRWYGSSNGYYSEEVSFCKVTKA